MDRSRHFANAVEGDVIVVHGHRLGKSERLGEILEVLGRPDDIHFRVRWEDDRISIFYPGNDASLRAVAPDSWLLASERR